MITFTQYYSGGPNKKRRKKRRKTNCHLMIACIENPKYIMRNKIMSGYTINSVPVTSSKYFHNVIFEERLFNLPKVIQL